MKNARGFSLLEIILAISILATIGLMTINLLSGQLTTRQKITETNNQEHSIDMALSKIVKDLQGAFLTMSDDSGVSTSYSMVSNNIAPKFIFSNSNLMFTTLNNISFIRNSNQSNLAMIRYSVRPDSTISSHKQLVRVVDTDMAESIERDGVGVSQVLIDDLEEFIVKFWDGRDFKTEWDSTVNDTINKLPKMVKIHVGMYFPESAVDKQLRELSRNTEKKDRKLLSLDTIVYLPNSAGKDEANPPDWSEYKWQ